MHYRFLSYILMWSKCILYLYKWHRAKHNKLIKQVYLSIYYEILTFLSKLISCLFKDNVFPPESETL